jgi:hypothetical protein
VLGVEHEAVLAHLAVHGSLIIDPTNRRAVLEAVTGRQDVDISSESHCVGMGVVRRRRSSITVWLLPAGKFSDGAMSQPAIVPPGAMPQ